MPDESVTIFEKFQVVGSYPALYIDSLDAVVISDLHLGLESLMAKAGTYMPKVQLEEVKEDLEAIVSEVEPEKLIVCGDIKHEFSSTTYGEREEVQDFIDFLSGLVEEILLVKGNHDNYLIYYVEDYDNVQLEDYYVLDDILFMHGHEIFEDLETIDTNYVLIGHEHPSLALKDKVGVTEKIHCFLYGEMTETGFSSDDSRSSTGEVRSGRRLIVLPAFSGLAEGTPMNRVKNRDPDILSPVLKKKIDVKTMKAIGVDKEAGVFRFPEVGKI